jgi:hypothetical protein
VLLLDERIRPDGSRARTWARVDGAAVWIADDDGGSGPLPVAAVAQVMARFGRPLAEGVRAAGDQLALPGGATLRRLRFHAAVDATGRDYLVWEAPGAEPVAALATTAAAALRHLAARLGAGTPRG